MRQLLLAVALVSVFAGSAAAHEREFTLSRDWFLPHAGEFEVESRSFFNPEPNFFIQQFELEYGIADWFALEPGIEFTKPSGDRFETEALDVEARFSFGEFGYGRVLPAVNLEYEHPVKDEEEGDEAEDEHDRLELKVILSWYHEDGQDLSLNLNGGIELGGDHHTESEATLGYVRPLIGDDAPSPGWHHGVRGGAEFIEDLSEYHAGLGPLLVYRATEHLNMLAAYIIALNDREENLDQLRFLAEWEF